MSPPTRTLLVTAAVLSLTACGAQGEAEGEAPPPEVAIVKVASAPVALTEVLPGRVLAVRTAEIRPQVGGVIQRRLFTEGADVRAGQALFQIEAAPFRADAESAQAALRRAEAVRNQARIQAERLKPLIQADAVSRQTYDNAVSALEQAEADVGAARAAFARRKLDVGFATIRSPISGRIGAAAVTEGALASAGETAPLAVVHQLDQVFVDVRLPAERIHEIQAAGGRADRVEILDGDGVSTGLFGRMLFSELLVDAGTGDVRVRIVVNNPARRLLPGMFVRARLPRGAVQSLPRAPQQAVGFANGGAQVITVDAKGLAQLRPVTAGPLIDNQYVITGGLSAGQSVVVEGRDRVTPGQPVKARAKAAAPTQR